jgi:riboflavin synthase
MFTGLIEDVGTVTDLARRGNYIVMTVATKINTAEFQAGESVACDGACLTVVEKSEKRFVVEASQETVATTILGDYRKGSCINLERALKVGDRLGGHFVSGHVDDKGTVESLKPVGESLELAVKYDPSFDSLVVEKGSVAINGISLTVNRTRSGWFSVNLIPFTASRTNVNQMKAVQAVNLEFDLIGKYITKFKGAHAFSGLTEDKLKESGW